MVRLSSSTACATALLTFALHSTAINAMFSVHEDLLAYPQYEVRFPDSPDSYITEEEAERKIASMSQRDQQRVSTSSTSTPSETPSSDTDVGTVQHQSNGFENGAQGDHGPDIVYEHMMMNSKRYLCSIPLVQPPPKLNATERRKNRDDEEKELARATTSGMELLKTMEGSCLYFISGWWSYAFCYNDYIKQFHGLPPQNGLPALPPKEDPNSASYILGRAAVPDKDAKPELTKDKEAAVMELQANGELKYLVQKLGGGTLCDITGKERKIELQYHCSPKASTDKIAYIKEVTTCCYLMVVYTPRLCTDAAFLPPPENVANTIECLEIMNEERIKEYKAEKELKELKLQSLLDMVAPDLTKGKKSKGEKQKLNVLDAVQGKYKIKADTLKPKKKPGQKDDKDTFMAVDENGQEQMFMVQEMDLEEAAALLGLNEEFLQLQDFVRGNAEGGGAAGGQQAAGEDAAEAGGHDEL